jgi:sphingomyelin phosphodiesterase
MESDPSGQLAWLVTELEAAETAGERVWLLGHMPMGSYVNTESLISYAVLFQE